MVVTGSGHELLAETTGRPNIGSKLWFNITDAVASAHCQHLGLETKTKFTKRLDLAIERMDEPTTVIAGLWGCGLRTRQVSYGNTEVFLYRPYGGIYRSDRGTWRALPALPLDPEEAVNIIVAVGSEILNDEEQRRAFETFYTELASLSPRHAPQHATTRTLGGLALPK